MTDGMIDYRDSTLSSIRDELFNPLDPAVLEDPFPTYRRLREADPVHWHGQLQSWTLSRYRDCHFALGDPDLFTSDFRRVGLITPPELLSIQTLDPPDHTPLREMLIDGFRTQDFAGLERTIKEQVQRLLAELSGRQRFDFVTDFADPIALTTMSTFVGVEPLSVDDAFVRLNADLDRSMDSGLAPETESSGLHARSHFNGIVRAWLAADPRRGLLRYVAQHRHRSGVSDEVLVNSLRAFFHAGFEVPSRFLGNAMLSLLRQPGTLDDLRRVRSLDTALTELVRFAGPVQAVSRACTRDIQLGGRRIRHGDVVVLLLGAANRDPEEFDDPEQLILTRQPNSHLGFGRGAHSCLGFHIGLIEARAALETVVREYPTLRLAGDPVIRPNATLRGLAHLPVAI